MDPARARSLTVLTLAFTVLAAMAGPAAAGPGKAEARATAAAAAYDTARARMASGTATVDVVYTWSVRWLDAQRDLPGKGKALAAAAQAHLERMTALQDEVAKAVERGAAPAADKEATTYYRLEAELWVERKGKR